MKRWGVIYVISDLRSQMKREGVEKINLTSFDSLGRLPHR